MNTTVLVLSPLYALVYSVFAALVTAGFLACLSYFLAYSFQAGQIFSRYGLWLEARRGKLGFWYKPLGGCAVCMNVWLGLLTAWLPLAATEGIAVGWWQPVWLLGTVLLANALLRKLLGSPYPY